MKKQYIIYDSRAILIGTGDACVMLVCDSLDKAIKEAPEYGDSCCIYSYDDDNGNLINEKFERQL